MNCCLPKRETKNASSMKHFNILMISLRFNEVPGGWTYFKEMSSCLVKAGYGVVVISPKFKGFKEYEIIDDVEIYRVKSLYLPQIPITIPSVFDLYRILSKILPTHHIDIVYDVTSSVSPTSLMSLIFFKLRRKHIPWVTHIAGELKDFQNRPVLNFLFLLYLNSITRMLLSCTSRILVAGERIIPRFARLGAKPDKVEVVHFGLIHVDKARGEKDSPSAEEVAEIRESLGLCPDNFVVGYIGRLSYGKGIDIIITAVDYLKDKIPEIRLVIVGAGNEECKLRNIASASPVRDRVQFLGWRDDVIRLLRVFDIFVTPSISEAGVSASLLEAMTTGIPCIVTPFTDVIEHMVNGLVIPFNDERALAHAMYTLYTDVELSEQISINAKISAEAITSQYTWEQYTNKMDRVFRAVLKSNSS